MISKVEQPQSAPKALDASRVKVTLKSSSAAPKASSAVTEDSRKAFTDHMVVADWSAEHGWADPEIKPYGEFALMPTASVLHYSTVCYEGMKLYRGYDGKLRLYRPTENAARMITSAERISLPPTPPSAFVALIKKLCSIDGPKWLPKDRTGEFLYIRPCMIGTDSSMGFDVPKEAKFFVVMCGWATVANVAPEGLRLVTSRSEEVRAWPGGTGNFKVGPNYGPTLRNLGEAKKRGFDMTLWLFGESCQITEAGSSNYFVIWKNATSGKLELVTSPVGDGLILPGITRQSVLTLARERMCEGGSATADGLEPLEVVERKFTMSDLVAAQDQGTLVASFAVGTAYFVTPVRSIDWNGKEIIFNSAENKHMLSIKKWLGDIMYGNVASEWAEIVEE